MWGWDSDGANARVSLGCTHDGLALDVQNASRDRHDGLVEIKVLATQLSQLAEPEGAPGGQQDHGLVPRGHCQHDRVKLRQGRRLALVDLLARSGPLYPARVRRDEVVAVCAVHDRAQQGVGLGDLGLSGASALDRLPHCGARGGGAVQSCLALPRFLPEGGMPVPNGRRCQPFGPHVAKSRQNQLIDLPPIQLHRAGVRAVLRVASYARPRRRALAAHGRGAWRNTALGAPRRLRGEAHRGPRLRPSRIREPFGCRRPAGRQAAPRGR